MRWHQVAANWRAVVPVISDRWPRTDETELAAIEGDRARFEKHLSSSHDLTRAEAKEEVDRWLMGAMPVDLAVSGDRDSTNISESGWHIPVGEDVSSEDRGFGDDRLQGHPLGRSREA